MRHAGNPSRGQCHNTARHGTNNFRVMTHDKTGPRDSYRAKPARTQPRHPRRITAPKAAAHCTPTASGGGSGLGRQDECSSISSSASVRNRCRGVRASAGMRAACGSSFIRHAPRCTNMQTWKPHCSFVHLSWLPGKQRRFNLAPASKRATGPAPARHCVAGIHGHRCHTPRRGARDCHCHRCCRCPCLCAGA